MKCALGPLATFLYLQVTSNGIEVVSMLTCLHGAGLCSSVCYYILVSYLFYLRSAKYWVLYTLKNSKQVIHFLVDKY